MTSRAAADGLWFRRFQPAHENAFRLLALPHAGGSASFYLPLAKALAPGVEVLAVQYPGRQDRRREPCVETVVELAERIYAMLDAYLDRPLAIFGHSMGALVGFELAGLFERKRGESPSSLFVSGRRAPSRYYEENVHQGDDNAIIAEMTKLSGTDARILGDEEMLRMVLPAIRSDYKAVETYRMGATTTVGCPVSVLVGDDDPKTLVDDAAAWREHTTGAFDLKVLPGGHFYLVAQAQPVLAYVSARIAAVMEGRSNRGDGPGDR
jgi:surfactin synthase thioesterase subunit